MNELESMLHFVAWNPADRTAVLAAVDFVQQWHNIPRFAALRMVGEARRSLIRYGQVVRAVRLFERAGRARDRRTEVIRLMARVSAHHTMTIRVVEGNRTPRVTDKKVNRITGFVQSITVTLGAGWVLKLEALYKPTRSPNAHPRTVAQHFGA